MKNEILYVGQFKLPDGDAAAIRVSAIADALKAAGYQVSMIGECFVRPAARERVSSLLQRLMFAVNRGVDYFLTSASFIRQLGTIDWARIAVVICYPGSASLIQRLMRLCRNHGVPLIIDSTEWYDTTHTLGGRFGPFALDSEIRMNWIYPRVKNLICISSFLESHYAERGCNVIRIPPLVGVEHGSKQPAPIPAVDETQKQISLVYAGFPGRKELFPEIIAGLQAARKRGIDVWLNLVGTSDAQLKLLLKQNGYAAMGLEGVTCYGRLPRTEALQIVAKADFTVILRPQARYANAGFPSKLVESLALGVPVISNATSDIADYLRDGLEGYLLREPSAHAIEDAIIQASQLTLAEKCQMRLNSRRRAEECFGYEKYSEQLRQFVLSARPC